MLLYSAMYILPLGYSRRISLRILLIVVVISSVLSKANNERDILF